MVQILARPGQGLGDTAAAERGDLHPILAGLHRTFDYEEGAKAVTFDQSSLTLPCPAPLAPMRSTQDT
ncbi:hypothetical protein G3M53_57330 [Streptomyces sp. SID7982]|nr:hypothetical protein [Streptomyces sp. SID7982]